MTFPFDEEPDFSAPIEPVRPSRARPWMAAISILLIVIVIITGLAGFGLPLLWHPSEVTVTTTQPTAAPPAATATAGAGGAAAQLAVIDDGGGLATMDASGGSVVRHGLENVRFTFPAWSPDGSRIAVIGASPAGSGVYVFPVSTTSSAAPASAGASSPATTGEPVALYQDLDRPAFYLYWTPGGGAVGFLTAAPSGSIDLRFAPADARAEATIVRQGSPMYWAWIDDARLLVHAGGGTGSFLGEIGTDGEAATGSGAPLEGVGDFRAPAVSSGGRFRAYAGRGADRTPAVIVEPRDPRVAATASRTEVKVLGPAALEYDPAGDRLAFVARATGDAPNTELPVGPLKIVDSTSGKVRVLLPGSVIAFFWSPDGRSIAALRLSSAGTPATADRPGRPLTGIREASVAVNAATSPGLDLQLAFVNPADGTVRSERSVRPGEVFATQVLPYFDQYALSHRIWSADGTSVVLPVVADDGTTEIRVFPADGSADARVAKGVAAFWRP